MSRCEQCNSCQSQWDDSDCKTCGWPTTQVDYIDLIRERNALKLDNANLVEALALADGVLSGANMNLNVVERKVKAALRKHEVKL
jgi:hypothetical protein